MWAPAQQFGSAQLALSFQREVVFREEFQLNLNFLTVVELVHCALDLF